MTTPKGRPVQPIYDELVTFLRRLPGEIDLSAVTAVEIPVLAAPGGPHWADVLGALLDNAADVFPDPLTRPVLTYFVGIARDWVQTAPKPAA